MNTAVIKLGGSVLYDSDLNFNIAFLKKIVAWYENQTKYNSVVFVVGGGRLSRFLVNQVKDDVVLDRLKHRIGIKVTNVNVSMARGFFSSDEVECFENLGKICNSIKNGNVKVGIIGGIKEGWSTDMVAAHIAQDLGEKIICKISNIDFIYSCDPKENKDAKPIESISWDEYIELFKRNIGKRHEPNMNAPIDIECSKFCKENNMHFRVSGGDFFKQDLEIQKILESGTLVL